MKTQKNLGIYLLVLAVFMVACAVACTGIKVLAKTSYLYSSRNADRFTIVKTCCYIYAVILAVAGGIFIANARDDSDMEESSRRACVLDARGRNITVEFEDGTRKNLVMDYQDSLYRGDIGIIRMRGNHITMFNRERHINLDSSY